MISPLMLSFTTHTSEPPFPTILLSDENVVPITTKLPSLVTMTERPKSPFEPPSDFCQAIGACAYANPENTIANKAEKVIIDRFIWSPNGEFGYKYNSGSVKGGKLSASQLQNEPCHIKIGSGIIS